ncbi:MAG: hypothetical protein LUC91_10785 [Prevotella sp.]|nr:hypothetical protein [Prevotella sp.]
MDDLVNIRIPLEADKITAKLKDKYFFSTNAAVERFALAYAMRNCMNELKARYEELDSQYPSDGTNLNVGTIDFGDSIIKNVVSILVPECSTPYRFIRVAIILGIYKIQELMNNNSDDLEVIRHIFHGC